MDPKYYCDSMYSELTFLKAKVYDMIRRVNQMPAAEKTKFMENLPELHGLVDHLTARLDQLNRECPVDWKPMQTAIEKTKKELVEKINWWDKEHIAGGYVGG